MNSHNTSLTSPSPCIETKEVWFNYEPKNPVLKGITLAIPEGDFVAVMGQNGSGKTTLVKHFNGLLRPSRGQVDLFGKDTRETDIGELARSVGYVFQNPDHQIFSPTTRTEIAFGPRNIGLSEAEVQERTDFVLSAFKLLPYAEHQPATLGYGLRRKISIAAVYAMFPKILILDEPTTGLDWQSVQELMSLLEDYHQQGHTVLVVTHDMRLIAEFIPYCLIIHAGRLLYSGATRNVFQHIELLKQAQLGIPQITELAARLAPFGFRSDILSVAEFCAEYARLSLQREEASRDQRSPDPD
jgi:energy-coupling factor transporter ATP-binding protein EcfA2